MGRLVAMGCNIHIRAQRRDEAGIWEHMPFPEVASSRNYSVYSILAGVRGGCEPICEPRGIPDDFDWDALPLCANGWTAEDDFLDDGHHASWLSGWELHARACYDQSIEGDDAAEVRQWLFWAASVLEMYGKPNETRLVFWFDG